MLDRNRPETRRHFIRFVAGAAVAIPVVNLIGCSDKPATSTEAKPAPAAAPQAATAESAAMQPAAMPAAPAAAQPAAAPAADLIKLTEDDPTAAALGYHEDATQVDAGKYPRRAGPEGATQFCHNCSLYLGQEGQERGGCSLFPGKSVNANGWCNGWVAKA